MTDIDIESLPHRRAEVKKINPAELTLESRMVSLKRVAKVVTGGKRFRFTALMVVGDGKGHVGVGLGKAREVPEAVRKGEETAKRNIIEVPFWIQGENRTIPHEVVGEWESTRVLLKPAAPGTGVIASGVVRAILELAGYTDILTKIIGSTNPVNTAYATMKALKYIRSLKHEAELRGKQPSDLFLNPEKEEA